MRTRLLLLASLVASPLVAQQDATPPAPAPVSVEPVASITATPAKSKDTLSVDFPDEEIRTILRNVADLFELNLVIPDTLQGRTSLKLREVTWRQIFQVVLSPVGYSFIEDGNIIKIVSQDTLQSEPFITDTVVLENVGAGGIQPLLSGILTPGRAATATAPAVPGGSIVLNALANELIITDQAVVVRKISEMAKRLDAEPKQVVIETKFVEITKTDASEFALKAAAANTVNGTFLGGNTFNAPLHPATGVGAAGTGAFNAILDAEDFTILLTALDSLDGTRLVSSPTIVAINGSKSDIKIGLDKQLITATQNTASTGANITTTYTAGGTQFAGVKIAVTPQITSSKLVTLKLKTEKSELVSSFLDPNSGQEFFDINIREGDLSIILRDGQTAAIGGLMDTNTTKRATKVPILGSIPVLGALFRTKDDLKIDRNLLIFITASILEPSKMNYTHLASPQQLEGLKLTDRDIQGTNYKSSPEEAALYEAAKASRQAQQDAAIKQQLNDEAKKAEKKKK